MDVTLRIPDALAPQLAPEGGDLARVALESLALEALRSGRITEAELRQMLGLARVALDGFLKTHGIYQEYTLADFEQERWALKELGL